MCTVCYITNQPVLTVKGACNIGDIDWNYYPSLGTKNELEFYEGYKKTNIVFDKNTKSWKFSIKSGEEQSFAVKLCPNDSLSKYPVGRKTWSYVEAICEKDEPQYNMTLSKCNFPSQFTCDSGHCIDIHKRCNENVDCLDGSDESLCSLIHITPSYNKANAPKSVTESRPLEINIQTTLQNIDSIDTVWMVITLTLEIRISWRDKRLTFSNPSMERENRIPKDVVSKLWSPLQHLIHENAILGEIEYEDHTFVKLLAIVPEDVDPGEAIEERLFNGSCNSLAFIQRVKLKYNCNFNVRKYPFDEQRCSFIMKINQLKPDSLSFTNQGNISYSGLSIIDQFSIGDMYSKVNNTKDSTKYIITLNLRRISTSSILTVFIPTVVLWLFGYSTLFIDPEHHIDRFMGSGTALLVITTLLNAINSDLPKTSYMKFIDLWFVWHGFSVLCIICYNITLGRMIKHFETPFPGIKDIMELNYRPKEHMEKTKTQGKEKSYRFNQMFMVVFPIINMMFYVVYFTLSM